jgi:hypothetical protein
MAVKVNTPKSRSLRQAWADTISSVPLTTPTLRFCSGQDYTLVALRRENCLRTVLEEYAMAPQP